MQDAWAGPRRGRTSLARNCDKCCFFASPGPRDAPRGLTLQRVACIKCAKSFSFKLED